MDQITKEDFQHLQHAVNGLMLSAQRIERALLGDKEMKLEGIASKVSRHEEHINNSKTRAGWITGVSAGIGFSLHQVVEWFKHNF